MADSAQDFGLDLIEEILSAGESDAIDVETLAELSAEEFNPQNLAARWVQRAFQP
jgi:hypothetical protein